MIDNRQLFGEVMHVSHFLRFGHGKPAVKMAPGQQRILAILGQRAPITQRNLTDESGVSPATLSELLSKMEAKDLIKREKSEADRRVTIVMLTKKGNALAQKIAEHETNLADEVFGCLNDEQRSELSAALNSVITNWEAQQENSPRR